MCECVCARVRVYIQSIQHNEPLFFILNSLFDTERNNLFMEDRTIEIKLYWLKARK